MLIVSVQLQARTLELQLSEAEASSPASPLSPRRSRADLSRPQRKLSESEATLSILKQRLANREEEMLGMHDELRGLVSRPSSSSSGAR